MSIRDEIAFRRNEGRLFHVGPTLPSAPVERFLFASPEVYRLVVGPWRDEAEEYRCGKLLDDFDRFVEGRVVTLALGNPYRKPRPTYLSRLDSSNDEVWEIRSRDPRPAIRVFGRFAECDTFIALNWEYRSRLGGSGSAEFAREINKTKSEWRRLFPTYEPHSGATVNEYVSENCFPV
jgi:hypothetical protein